MREGWATKRLLDITTKIGSGATPRGGKSSYKESGISLFRSLNIHDGKFKEKNLAFIDNVQADKLSNVIVDEGDVLLNITGASISRCCAAPKRFLPARVNQHVAIIRPKPELADTNYLAYLLVSKEYKDALLHTGEKAGATRQALTKTQLQGFKILLPPLPEQKRIVVIIDEAFEGIDKIITNAEKNLTNARKLFENCLNTVFIKKGEGWQEQTIGELCDFLNGFAFKSTDTIQLSNVQLIRMGNLYQNTLNLDRKPAFYPDHYAEEYARYVLSEGDLIMSLTGTVNKEDYGYTVEIPASDRVLLLNQRIVKFTNIREDLIDRRYFLYFLRSRRFLKELYSSARGVRQANLSSVSMKKLAITFPEVDEQKCLIQKFDALESKVKNLEDIYQKKLSALAELKQALLQKAFAGELTTEDMAIKDEAVA